MRGVFAASISRDDGGAGGIGNVYLRDREREGSVSLVGAGVGRGINLAAGAKPSLE